MNKKAVRMVVDVLLTVLLVAAMLVQLTGQTIHEIIGVVFFVGIIAHLALSFKWLQGVVQYLSAKKAKARTKQLLLMAVLLCVDVVILAISSVVISRILASVGLASTLMSSFWKGTHTVTSYLLCILTVVHLVMHWGTVFSWVHIPYDPARRKAITAGVSTVGVLGIAALAFSCADVMQWLPSREEDDLLTTEDIVREKGSSSTVESTTAPKEGEKEAEVDPRTDSSANPGHGSSRQDASSSSRPESSSGESSGICPLCKKRCPLSNPLCDRPYLEGLL